MKLAIRTAFLAFLITGSMAAVAVVATVQAPANSGPEIGTPNSVSLEVPADPTMGYPPCEQEDGVGCYWDASEQGNGVGCSFTTLPHDVVVYWDPKGCDKFVADEESADQ